jgi:imidazolonepropionase-like amidohydrolase
MRNIFICLFLLTFFSSYSQVPEPVNNQRESIVLINGTIHVGNGNVIENGAIAFENGKITYVGNNFSKSQFSSYKIIDVDNKEVYPGLIIPNSRVGLEDISAVRATVDHTELGDINSNIRSLIAYNTDSEMISTFRFNGVLLAQVTPSGGLITGNSSIMMLEGWNWEDAVYKADEGIHINWPRKFFPPNPWRGSTEFTENPNYKSVINLLDKFLIDSRIYYNKNPETINLKLEAMKNVYRGTKKIYLHVETRDQIIESVQLLKKRGIDNLVLVGVSDAYYALDFIKENNLPVLLDNLHRVPSRNHEDVDLPYKLPYILHREGILVGLTAGSGRRVSLHGNRNLPFLAGTASAYGLGKEDALKMVTLNTSKILGIDKITGSLEEGKDANIVVSSGDILDMKSSKVELAFITGRKINLDGKQQVLYDRFKRKYSE